MGVYYFLFQNSQWLLCTYMHKFCLSMERFIDSISILFLISHTCLYIWVHKLKQTAQYTANSTYVCSYEFLHIICHSAIWKFKVILKTYWLTSVETGPHIIVGDFPPYRNAFGSKCAICDKIWYGCKLDTSAICM